MKGIKLGLISNAPSSEVQVWQDSPLAELFDAVSISCHYGHAKQQASIYERTMSALGVEPSCRDGGSGEHFGAYAVGMKPVLITHYLYPGEYSALFERYRSILYGVVGDLRELLERWFAD